MKIYPMVGQQGTAPVEGKSRWVTVIEDDDKGQFLVAYTDDEGDLAEDWVPADSFEVDLPY